MHMHMHFMTALAGQPFLRVYLTAEHTGCELVHEPSRTPPPADAREALRRGSRLSRTSVRQIWPRLLTQVLFWNMPYPANVQNCNAIALQPSVV